MSFCAVIGKQNSLSVRGSWSGLKIKKATPLSGQIRWCEETHDIRDWDEWVPVDEAVFDTNRLAFSFVCDEATYEVSLIPSNDQYRGQFRAKAVYEMWGGSVEATVRKSDGRIKVQGRWEERKDEKESFFFELELS